MGFQKPNSDGDYIHGLGERDFVEPPQTSFP